MRFSNSHFPESDPQYSHFGPRHDLTALTYSDATVLFYQLLTLNPACRMTIAEVHEASIGLCNVRPIAQDASWQAYTGAKAPCLKEF